MTEAIGPWREADVCLDKLLNYPESAWGERIDGFDMTPEARKCLARLIRATHGDGPLDHSISLAPYEDEEVGHLVGQTVGSWRLVREIGRGGMAVVYEASRIGVDFKQTAAIKLLARGSTGRSLFLREQALLAQLEHPFIARFLDAGVAEDGTPWIAMERIVGTPLERVTEGWDHRSIVHLMRRIIDAVAYAHRHLVIHRDLKPGNVLVDDDGRPRLLDFGIAKMLSTENQDSATRLLTPEYAAPEQFSGSAVSTATDVYGIGAMLYRLLAGQAPRLHSGEINTDLKKITDPDLRSIVEKALREEPGRRYETADALSTDLNRWLQRQPVLARPDSRRYRFERWIARHRAAAAGGALVVAALLLGSGGVAWQTHETAKQASLVSAQNAVLSELITAPQRTARGRRVEMADVLDDALTVIDQQMPTPSLERISLLFDLAVTQEQLGRSGSAVELWQRSLDDLDAVAPNDRRRSIQARLGLARSLIAQENLAIAEDALAELNAEAEAELSVDDELRALIALHRYRSVRRQGVTPSARLIEDALAAGDAVTWQNDLALGTFRCGRLQILVDTGQFARAADDALDYLAWAESKWGVQSGHTLCAFEIGVVALSRAGRLEQAAGLAFRGEQVASEWLGDVDRVSFGLRTNRANILQELGRNDDAIEIHRAQIEVLNQTEGLTASDRTMPYQGLAVALMAEGRYGEAEPIQRLAVRRLQESVGTDTPASYLALANLAELRVFDGRPEDALEPIEAAFQGMSRSMGLDHPVTIFTRSIRGGVRLGLNDVDGAMSDLSGAPEQLAAAFGENDVNVMNSRAWLAGTLNEMGRVDEALVHAHEVYDWHLGHKGKEHPRTLAIGALITDLSSND